jgi:hypothetical protein
METIKFMLVLGNFETYIVNTPFVQNDELQEWVGSIKGNTDFVGNPLANLPPRSFANLLLTQDEINEDDHGHDPETVAVIDNKETWDGCHGTLMVDDNDSVFYSVRINKTSEWKLPFVIKRGT